MDQREKEVGEEKKGAGMEKVKKGKRESRKKTVVIKGVKQIERKNETKVK